MPCLSRTERAEHDLRLLVRYHRAGDQRAREELIERMMPLARRLARRYARSGEPLEDLTQVAAVGLVKAIDRFDPSRGFAFTTFAVPTMQGELKRHLRDHGWAAHVPRGMQERAQAIEKAIAELSRRNGRQPHAREIAEHLDLQLEDVVEALTASAAHDSVSLESHRLGDSDEGQTYAEVVGAEDERFDLVEHQATIAPALAALPARDRLVLHLRFAQDMTQEEIAQRIGVSQMHVSRILRRALARLQTVAEHGDAQP